MKISDATVQPDMNIKDNTTVLPSAASADSLTDDSLQTQGSPSATIGMVTVVTENSGVIGEMCSFKLEDCTSEYKPSKGDWVSMKTITDPDTGATTAKQVKPLRQKTFNGVINSCQTGFGYVDRDVYFTFNTCEEGYVPRRGDRVCGQAVESSKGRNQWRAISVSPVQDNLKDKYLRY